MQYRHKGDAGQIPTRALTLRDFKAILYSPNYSFTVPPFAAVRLIYKYRDCSLPIKQGDLSSRHRFDHRNDEVATNAQSPQHPENDRSKTTGLSLATPSKQKNTKCLKAIKPDKNRTMSKSTLFQLSYGPSATVTTTQYGLQQVSFKQFIIELIITDLLSADVLTLMHKILKFKKNVGPIHSTLLQL